jgi:hypothetical protein
MTFFEPLPSGLRAASSSAQPLASSAWEGPPYGVVPAVVALELLLAHTDRLAIYVPELVIYPKVVALRLELLGRQTLKSDVETGPGTWRLGVQLSDGTKATSYGFEVDPRIDAGLISPDAVTAGDQLAVSLQPQVHRLTRGGTAWGLEYWLSPLPLRGGLTLACEWPNVDLGLTTAAIATEPILDAAGRVRELWSD